MNSPPRRARFQIHLSTAIVLMFTAGLLIWANVYYKPKHNSIKSWKTATNTGDSDKPMTFDYVKYGWPYRVSYSVTNIENMSDELKQYYFADADSFDGKSAAADFIIAFLILAVVWYTCEWLIRWRAARKGA